MPASNRDRTTRRAVGAPGQWAIRFDHCAAEGGLGRRTRSLARSRDLSGKRYVYFWVDGIHVQARLEDDAQCLLIIGATPALGRKSRLRA